VMKKVCKKSKDARGKFKKQREVYFSLRAS
jgi:hypothetical protein